MKAMIDNMRRKDEQVNNMTKELDRLRQRNTQLNMQLVQSNENATPSISGTEENIIRVLQSQINLLTEQNKELNTELTTTK